MEFWLYLLLFYMPNIVETARDPMTGYLTPDVSAPKALVDWPRGGCPSPRPAATFSIDGR